MKNVFLFLLLILATGCAGLQVVDPHFIWEAPTTSCDGLAIPSTQVVKYKVYVKIGGGAMPFTTITQPAGTVPSCAPYNVVNASAPGVSLLTPTPITAKELKAVQTEGPWTVAVSACKEVGTNCIEGAFTEKQYTVKEPAPAPPTALTVQ